MYPRSCKVADIDKIGKDNSVEFVLLQDSQDISAMLESTGLKQNGTETVTAFAAIKNGEYVAVYSLTHFMPYLTDSVELIWHPLSQHQNFIRSHREGKARYWRLKPYINSIKREFVLKVQRTEKYHGERVGIYFRFERIDIHKYSTHTVLFEDIIWTPRGELNRTVMREVLGWVTLRPGDTDADYFKDYDDEQLKFCERDAEAVSMFCEDPKERDR